MEATEFTTVAYSTTCAAHIESRCGSWLYACCRLVVENWYLYILGSIFSDCRVFTSLLLHHSINMSLYIYLMKTRYSDGNLVVFKQRIVYLVYT